MFKLSEGCFISPLKLENIFIQSEFVQQAVVWGEDSKEFVVAILVLDQPYLGKQATATGKSKEELTADPEIKKMVFQDIQRICA